MQQRHCLVNAKLLVTATVQLTAAYVPVSELPLTVAVTLKEHLCGLLGVRVTESVDPLDEPLTVPPLCRWDQER